MTAEPRRPVRGDVFVTRSGADAYDVGIVPGPPQFAVSGREVATAWACEFGRRKGVDVWRADDDASFLLLVCHRLPADPQGGFNAQPGT